MSVWIADASPIIMLGEIGLLSLLTTLPDKLIVPSQVAAEVLRGPGRNWILGDGSPYIAPVDINAAVRELNLGSGETAALSFGFQCSGSVLLLDDLAARKVAMKAGFPILGTVGILALAKKRGTISSFENALNDLLAAGYRVSPAVVAKACALVNEPHPS